MGTFLLRRSLRGAFTIFAISIVTFMIFFMMPGTGDPAVRMAGKNPTPELIASIEEEYCLNQIRPVTYWCLMKMIVSGDLNSRSTGTEVTHDALKAVPVTFSLALVASTFWLVGGITFGIIGAKRNGTGIDRLIMVLGLMGVAIPMAWLSLYSLALFTVWIPIFPPGDYLTVAEGGIFGWFGHLILPGATLAVVYTGIYALMSRGSILDAMREEYVKTAVAKGLPGKRVFTQHILRTGLIPIVVLFGLDLGALMGGAIFTETIFGLPGLGSFLMNGIANFDFTILIVGSIFAATFVVIANMLVDVIQAIIDPRIRLA